MPAADLPDEAWLAALSALPGVGPARLGILLENRSPAEAWQAIGARPESVAALCGAKNLGPSWRLAHQCLDVSAQWKIYRDRGVGALSRHSAAYPDALADDPDPPAVLFTDGDVTALGPLRVGVVGTRRCTRYGSDLARELGALLAASGVTVISGLASGIDAAAHVGALEAGQTPPVAVAGTALDDPYPRANRALWAEVARAGLVCSETPLGAPAEKWRFPARNRIIAGLSQVVVVVESHETGGSLYTAAEAMERGRTVFAVPGPIRSEASFGCNRLLGDGCVPLCEVSDVLIGLGLAMTAKPPASPVEISSGGAEVLDILGWRPGTLDQLAADSPTSVDDLALCVEQLVASGVLAWRGRWLERTAVVVRVCRPNDPTDAHSARSRRQRGR